jgi:hypothetical protein
MDENKKKLLLEQDALKYEVARELGLSEKIKQQGWGGLSNAECGRIGGIMSRRLRQQGASAD